MKLICNNKSVELDSQKVKDGYIATKQFGKVRIRFASDVLTIGAGDFYSGGVARDNVVAIFVPSSKAKEFSGFLRNPS